jgi:hypothetical protein
LWTLPGQPFHGPVTPADLLLINNSVKRILQTVIKNQMRLEFKLENLLELSRITIHHNIVTVTASDSAYYHTL